MSPQVQLVLKLCALIIQTAADVEDMSAAKMAPVKSSVGIMSIETSLV